MPARSSTEGTFGFGIPGSGAAPRTWTTVIDGDGSVVTGNGRPVSFYITGPNDSTGNGWSAVKSFFPTGATIVFDWSWTTVDGIAYDWPFAITSVSEPFSYPSPAKLASANTQFSNGAVLNVPSGNWASFGCYSSDTCCGRGWAIFSGLPAT